MKQWLDRIWGVVSSIIVAGDALAGIVTFLFGDLSDILGRLEPYRTSMTAIVILALMLGFYVLLFWKVSREVWRVFRGWVQRWRDKRRLKALDVEIAKLKQMTYECRIQYHSSAFEFPICLKDVMDNQDTLRDQLAALHIPTPKGATVSSH